MKQLVKNVKRITDFLIYGNFYISLCAALLIYESYILFRTEASFFYSFLGFFATLFIYNIDRLLATGGAAGYKTERHLWLKNNLRLVSAFTILAAIILLISVFYLPFKVLIFLTLLGVISMAYSIPFIIKGKSFHGLRSIRGLKIFLIVYVWANTTVLLPAIDSGLSLADKEVVLLFIERSLFLFIICLPFDIRDYKVDIENNVKTIPGMIGIKATRKLVFACLAAFLAVSFYHYPVTHGLFWARFISAVTTFIFVYKAKEHYHEYYFTGLLDGTMIIQFLLILFLHDVEFAD